MDTPILLNVQETLVFNKQLVFAATNVARLHGEFEENIYAISTSGDLAYGPSKIFHTATRFAVTHLPFSTTIQTISRDDQTLFLYASNPSQLWAYPLSLLVGAGWETNAAPVARFVWSPASPTTRSVIEFDSTDSTDDQGGGTALTCRWDWESDGVFDTPFTNALTVTYRFANAGTKTVTVQVKDGYGATGSVAHTFDVVHEDDPDLPGGGNPQFEIQFVASDIAFDPVRPSSELPVVPRWQPAVRCRGPIAFVRISPRFRFRRLLCGVGQFLWFGNKRGCPAHGSKPAYHYRRTKEPHRERGSIDNPLCPG